MTTNILYATFSLVSSSRHELTVEVREYEEACVHF